MKKILILSLAYYPRHVSGAEAAIKEITDRISDIEFHLITLRFESSDKKEERVGNVFVHRVGGGSYVGKIFFPLLAALKARSLHGMHHFDALWAMMTYMLLPTILAKNLGVHVPHILTLQDGDPYEKVFGRLRILPFLPLINWGFRTATVIQAISSYLAEWSRRRGSKAPVVLIHNGANPRDLADTVDLTKVEEVKKKFNKKQGDIWLVNTARLEYQKANDMVIRALAMLPAHIKFLLVGEGSEEQMLKDLAKELELQDRVLFVGYVDRSEVTFYRKAADIFVGPSRSEGLGNAFLSAMASRLPVIATAEGGLADFMVDRQTGWVVKKDNPEEIARAVEDILAQPEKVKEITERARHLVEKEYNWDIVAEQMRNQIFAKV
ncbi:MAG: glycosyltransferase family 4 protein [Candidatus Adlerbacteria bacterium]|nr:glycosyltransferase family 4 protein [Candidatus Adlerbacteria bacterium]